MDGTLVALAALGLTALVQVAGVAFIFGKMSAKLHDLRKDFYRHIDQPTMQAHGREQ